MKIKILSAIGMLATFICYDANAYNLNDAVTATLQNNQQIQVLKKRLEIEILAKPKVAAEFFPTVNSKLDRTYYDYKDLSGAKLPKKYNQGSLSLTIEQNIFAGGGTIARMLAADAQINAAYQDYAKELNRLIYGAIESYQKVLTLRELVKIQKESAVMAEDTVEKARITVDSGSETKTSLLDAEANLARVRSDLASYESQKSQVESSFEYYTGTKAPEKIEEINTEKYVKVPSLKDLEVLISQKNPDILKAKHSLKASKQGVNSAASKLSPRVNVFGRVTRQDGPLYYKDNPLYSQIRNDNNTYGISMDIPLFHMGDYVGISEARKANKQSEFNLRDVTNRVKAQTYSTWDQYISSGNVYDLSLQAEESQHQAYLGMKTEFEVGARSILDVTTAQQRYNMTMIDRLNKENEKKMTLFKIYELVGNLPEVVMSNNMPIVKK